jgi:hypothetical protein
MQSHTYQLVVKENIMIQNGKPVTIEINGHIDDALMSKEKPEVQAALAEWIAMYLAPTANAVLKTQDSYSLKHIFERDTGIYLTNNQFKDAMLMCGYNPVNPEELNWQYRISKKSPALQGKLDGARTLSIPRETLLCIWANK